MNSQQKAAMKATMFRINNEEAFDAKLKELFPEHPLCEYKVYNRNLAMRVMFNNVKAGTGTGDCLRETTAYYLQKYSPFNENTISYNSHLCKAYMYGGIDGTEIIFHCFIIIVSEGRRYYITHSNGIHKIVPFYKMMGKIINLELANFGMKEQTIKVQWVKFTINEYGNLTSCGATQKTRVSVKNRLANKIRQREIQRANQ